MTKKVLKASVDGDDYYDPDIVPLTTITPTPIVSPVVAKNNRTLQVSANPSELTDSEVVNYFTQSGPIEEVTIPFDKTKNKWKGFLYIVFESATIVDELIKTPTKMINGKKVLVAKKTTANINILNNAVLNIENFTAAAGSNFSSLMPANIAMSSTSSISSTTDSPQNLKSSSFTPLLLNMDLKIPFKGIPMPKIRPYAMPSVSGNDTPSSSVPAGISDIAGPSGLGGIQSIPMPEIHSYAMLSVSGNDTPSSSVPVGISDIGGPSGLGGIQSIPMPEIHSYAMLSVSGNDTPSSSVPAGISDNAGPSGLGGSHKK